MNMKEREVYFMSVDSFLYTIKKGKATRTKKVVSYPVEIRTMMPYPQVRRIIPSVLKSIRGATETPWTKARYERENTVNPCEKSRLHSYFEISYVTEDQCFRAVFNQPRI